MRNINPSVDVSKTKSTNSVKFKIPDVTKDENDGTRPDDAQTQYLEGKIEILQKTIDELIKENTELKQNADEAESVRLQIELCRRFKNDLQFCKNLEVENIQIKELIKQMYEIPENKSLIKFRSKELNEKYAKTPSLFLKVDEVDMYETYRKLVNANDEMKSENLFLKVELGRLRRLMKVKSSVKTENTILKHEMSYLKEKINNLFNRGYDTSMKNSSFLSTEFPGSSLSSSSSRYKNKILNPFKTSNSESKNLDGDSYSPSIDTNASTATTASIKSLKARLEGILKEEEIIKSHLFERYERARAKSGLIRDSRPRGRVLSTHTFTTTTTKSIRYIRPGDRSTQQS